MGPHTVRVTCFMLALCTLVLCLHSVHSMKQRAKDSGGLINVPRASGVPDSLKLTVQAHNPALNMKIDFTI